MIEKDLTVLVVDDESLILTLVNSFLRKSRFFPLLAADLNEARRICEETDRNIDIVLSDVSFPAQGRTVFWAALKQRFPHARVIHMSGFLQDQAAVPECTGPQFFLQKPFTGNDLMAALERASQVVRTAGGR